MHAQADGDGGAGAGTVAADGISCKDMIFLGLDPNEFEDDDTVNVVLHNIANALYNHAFAHQSYVKIGIGEWTDVLSVYSQCGGGRASADFTLGRALDATVRAIVAQIFRNAFNTMRRKGSIPNLELKHDMSNVFLASYSRYSAIARLRRLFQTFPERFKTSVVFVNNDALFKRWDETSCKVSAVPNTEYAYTAHVIADDISTLC